MRQQQTYSTQSNGGTLNDLSLQYDGNQLRKVTDQCSDLEYAGAMDFKDGANEAVEYTWDANGNMTSDLNKGITSIAYNVLNLPERIMYDDNHLVFYTYAADGRKLQVKYLLNTLQTIVQPGINPGLHGGSGESGLMGFLPPITPRPNPDSLEINPSNVIVTLSTVDYCAGHVYRNGVLERTMNDYGYRADSTYYYYIKDYQGHVRAVMNQNGTLKEINNYYPYGGLMGAASAGVQPHKYGSKELDRQNGLDWYDFEARYQDPMLPMFTTQDPLTEQDPSRSPYAYCAGNPIRFIDPSGEEWVCSSYMDLKGITHVNLKVTGVVYNNSSEDFNMGKVRDVIANQIQDVFSFHDDDNKYDIKMVTDIRVVSNVDDISEKDHVFQIVDNAKLSGTAIAEGQTFGLGIRISADLMRLALSGYNTRTIAHEVGHTGGLLDVNARNEDKVPPKTNLMTQISFLQTMKVKNPEQVKSLSVQQIDRIVNYFKDNKLNKKRWPIKRN